MAKRRFTQNFPSKEEEEEEDTRLNVFYCLHCGSFSLILGEPLSSLPRRRTDGSYVLDESKALRKNMREGDVKVVKRVNGLERQYRLECPECNLFIAYRPNDHNAEGKLIYILPEALGTRQELAGAIKHHSIEELRGQLASLLTKFPHGVLLSVLRNLFREHFAHDLDEREYGDYASMEDLIIKALPDIVRLDIIPQAGSDMLILPVNAPPTEQQPHNQSSSNTNNANSNDASTNTRTEIFEPSPPAAVETQEHEIILLLDELRPKSETDPNAPKLKPTDHIFQEKPKPPAPRPLITIKAIPKAKQLPQPSTVQQKQPNNMFALVSSDYD